MDRIRCSCVVYAILLLLLIGGGYFVVKNYTGFLGSISSPVVVDAPNGVFHDLPVVVDGQKTTWSVSELVTAFWWDTAIDKVVQYHGHLYKVISVKGDNPPTVTLQSAGG